MRRIQKQLGMLLAFLCTVILTGCNDEESNPLRFDQSVDEDNTVDVCFPRSEEDGSAGAVTILGGDGNYTAQCDNAAVLKIDILKVVVFQSKQTLAIDCLDVFITGGDQLTEEQQAALREEALAIIPVKAAGGGYRMIFDNPQDPYSGTLCFYPTEMDKEEEMVKGTFIVNSDRNEENLWNYRFQLEEKEHTLVFVPYSDKKTVTKADVLPTVALLEDVTGQIPTSYPGVEVFTQQVIQRP